MSIRASRSNILSKVYCVCFISYQHLKVLCFLFKLIWVFHMDSSRASNDSINSHPHPKISKKTSPRAVWCEPFINFSATVLTHTHIGEERGYFILVRSAACIVCVRWAACLFCFGEINDIGIVCETAACHLSAFGPMLLFEERWRWEKRLD